MVRIDTHPAVIRIVFSIMIAIAALATYAGAHAQESSEQINLGIAPVNVPGNFFDLTIEPGETRQLVVKLSNHGTAMTSARTFAADAYTIHGGGFGARLDGEPVTGTTLWLDYPTETLDLEASTSIVRTFSIRVPTDARPGQHITSLVIQNAVPVDGDGDGVSLKQINRQAIAVNVTVPGSTTPGLTIGDVAHHVAGVVSVVSFSVRNTGDVHLKPSGEVVLRDAEMVEVIRYPVAMDSFYAGTETQVEVPFSTHLDEGTYVATLTLRDDQYNVSATAGELVLEVPQAVETVIVPADEGSNVPLASQQTEVHGSSSKSGFPTWIIFVILGSVAVGIGIGIAILRTATSRRMRGVADVRVEAHDSPATAVSTSANPPRPAKVKPLIPRSNTVQEPTQVQAIQSSALSDTQ